MLELLEEEMLSVSVFNFSSSPLDDLEFAVTMELTKADLDDFRKASTTVAPPGGRRLYRSRFSNGDHEVFYTAYDLETCEEEMRHHLPLRVGSSDGIPTAYHFYGSRWEFSGAAKDLRNHDGVWPDLLHLDDYTFCNLIGAEAVAMKLDALIVRSVRHLGGTNLPVFALVRVKPMAVERELVVYHPLRV